MGQKGSGKSTVTAILMEKYNDIVVSEVSSVKERNQITKSDGLNILVKCTQQMEAKGPISGVEFDMFKNYDLLLFNDKEAGLERLKDQVIALYGVIYESFNLEG